MPTSAAVGKYPAALPEPLREIGEKVREIAGAVLPGMVAAPSSERESWGDGIPPGRDRT